MFRELMKMMADAQYLNFAFMNKILTSGSKPHPYPEQFTNILDLPDREWASQFWMIASTPRSGSHYLGHMLKETGEAGVPLEYMNFSNMRYWESRFGVEGSERIFPLIVRIRTSSNGVFCFKAHWKHFSSFQQDIKSLTRGVGLSKVIYIRRKDLLDQSISYSVAAQTGAWISGARSAGKGTYSYHDIVYRAKNIKEDNAAWIEWLALNKDIDSITVNYEDLCENLTEKERVEKFLNLSRKLTAPKKTTRQGGAVNRDWRDKFIAEIRREDMWILEGNL